MAKKAAPSTVTICLYGNRQFGFYCLASIVVPGQQLGTIYGKDPEQGGKRHESATVAIWNIREELLTAKLPAETPVEIHCDFGGTPMLAIAELSYIPAFGSLKWTQGTTYVISAEEVEKHAERVES